MLPRLFPFPAIILLAALSASAADGIPPIKRILPPPGIEIPAEERHKLSAGVEHLEQRLEAIRERWGDDHEVRDLIPDVEIYAKAVRYGLENDEFYEIKDIKRARDLLARGEARAAELLDADAGAPFDREHISWVRQAGTLVRGYRSIIDDSVQPYGVTVPENVDQLESPVPIYVWLHGRGDKMTEMAFMAGLKPPPISPPNAIILQPFGRYMNGFKFAGEIDVLDTIEQMLYQYLIVPDRVVLCGFSMGGAAAWHLGAHYADDWVAVSPGAGFAETAQYQRLTLDKYPPWYEQTLWGLYDAPDYVLNLFNLPVIAYSGEVDKQIQAARVMEAAFAKEGRQLEHLIGPGMGHKYHPDVLKQLQAKLVEAAKRDPRKNNIVTLQTRTLRYSQMGPIRVWALDEHWRDSRAVLDRKRNTLATKNVAALSLVFSDQWQPKSLMVDDQPLELVDREIATLLRDGGQWREVDRLPWLAEKHKSPGFQGPIDDGFLRSFLVVVPSGTSSNAKFERWMQFELAHFKDRWRRLFRGDVRLKLDRDVDDSDLERYDVILWGNRESNRLLEKMQGKLPLAWDAKTLKVNGREYDAAHHAPVMIYPNPLRHGRYVVLNSGFTFREGHDSSNSLQTPKLPDWAVVDLDTPPDANAPGKIVAADFFDEQWQYRKPGGPGQPMK